MLPDHLKAERLERTAITVAAKGAPPQRAARKSGIAGRGRTTEVPNASNNTSGQNAKLLLGLRCCFTFGLGAWDRFDTASEREQKRGDRKNTMVDCHRFPQRSAFEIHSSFVEPVPQGARTNQRLSMTWRLGRVTS